jgi:hypothetical protein
MSVDFRAGLKTGLTLTVTRSDTETTQEVAVGAPEPKVTLSKTVDTTQIKSDHLQTKLAVRRAWEGDSADVSPDSLKTPSSQNKTAAFSTSFLYSC